MTTLSEAEAIALHGPIPAALSVDSDNTSFWWRSVSVYLNDELSKDYWVSVDTVEGIGVRYQTPRHVPGIYDAFTETVVGRFRFEYKPNE